MPTFQSQNAKKQLSWIKISAFNSTTVYVRSLCLICLKPGKQYVRLILTVNKSPIKPR
jgi:hypothetical protein